MLVELLLFFLVALLAIPSILLFIEVLAANPENVQDGVGEGAPTCGPTVAVLIPAHNEGPALLPTLSDISDQLKQGDRVIVIADNCTDDTAVRATEGGAEVTVRNDPDKSGKGYALDWGIRFLSPAPPEVVIIVDADCRVAAGSINKLAMMCRATGRPAQALNLMHAPVGSKINFQLAEFAWRMKNWVRPIGLKRLGLPCHLMGTGMAFPWDLICSAELATGHITEDLKLGLDFAKAGKPALFCPAARVASWFPYSAAGARTQRQRWESGHLDLIGRVAPRFAFHGLHRWDFILVLLALDLAIPPLSFLVLLVLITVMLTGAAAGAGYWFVPFAMSCGVFSLIAFSICLAWLRFGTDVLSAPALLRAVPYALGKLPIYLRLVLPSRATPWLRTDRGNPGKED